MRVEASTTIPAPSETVFAKLTDIHAVEAMLSGRHVSLTQTAGGGVETGAAFTAEFRARGAQRSVDVVIQEVTAPDRLAARGEGKAMAMDVVMHLSPEGDGTKLTATLEVEGKSLQGRLLVQSAKLARGHIETRFAKGLAKFAQHLV